MIQLFRKVVNLGIDSAKKAINKSPTLKRKIKKVIEVQLGISSENRKYDEWLARNLPDFIDLITLKNETERLKYKPKISIILPTYNTPKNFLKECIDSVKAQVYDNWELCIVDDASTNKDVSLNLKTLTEKDNRIKIKFLKTNHHIAGATNKGIKLATGEYISFLDHDDILWPNALFEIVKALNTYQSLDIIYTDEDKIINTRHRHDFPFFKPDWNPDFLRSVNYITHFVTVRAELLNSVGGLREGFDGAQDWDLMLRLTKITSAIYHIPKVVYSWRVHDQSTSKSINAKPYVVEAQHKALKDDAIERGYPGAIIKKDSKHNGYWNETYPVKDNPLISIIIPTKNQYRVVKRCIDSIYKNSTYNNYEIILVDTGSNDRRVIALYKSLTKQHSNFKLVNWHEPKFSYSRSCNKGAKEAKGSLLMMLNNDTEVITRNWLELLAGDAQRKEIGAVGCLLFYPNGYIQHAGVGIGLGGYAANSFARMSLNQKLTQTQHLMINTKHDMTAVTAACLMIKKDLFEEVGGFDEHLRITYNDVDLCLKLYDKGLQNLYTPQVRLIHHESISVGMPGEIEKRSNKELKSAQALFKKRWSKYIENDPNINQNLDRENAFYDI